MVEKGFAAVEGDWQNLVAAVLAAQRQILPDLRLSTLGKPLSNPEVVHTWKAFKQSCHPADSSTFNFSATFQCEEKHQTVSEIQSLKITWRTK